MSSGGKLTLAFLDRAPKAAARVLQDLPAAEASAFLDTVPIRLVVPVLHSMIPWQAARRLELISVPRSAMVLRQLPFFDATSLARLLRPECREQVLEELPTRYARRLIAALQYPRHQVGAWIDAEVPTLNASNLVGDALRVLRAAGPASHIFLETPDHSSYLGTIEINEVLRSEPATPLERLKIIKSSPVSNRASLSSVSFDERWDDSIHLPVVGRRGNFLGGLSRASLRIGLREQVSVQRASSRTVLAQFIGALLTSYIEVLKVLVRSVKPQATRAHEVATNE